jgi:methylenetetrahydrofolate reductase (NADPH)
MTSLCKTIVPKKLTDDLELIKDNDEEVKHYGVRLAIEMCRTLKDSGIKGFHFYTLNLEKSVTLIVEGLGFIDNVARPMPWKRRSVSNGFDKEEVRPVFWNHRHQSYIKRTESWDDFPNGRWGDSRSPAFGELTDFHLGVSSAIAAESKTQMWGNELKGVEDVSRVFVAYCERKINELPWNDLPLTTESDPIREWLIQLNHNDYLTINSQPRVNCVPSTDPVHGWGGPNGWVYQKAYVEFFVSEDKLKLLLDEIQKEKYSLLSYHAVNYKGDKESTNSKSTNALTWGVFPDAEIKQPTVVDRESFLVWKDEAFALWQIWARQYPERSASRHVITEIQDKWFLVNIVDNDFVGASQGIVKLFMSLIATAAVSAPTSSS